MKFIRTQELSSTVTMVEASSGFPMFLVKITSGRADIMSEAIVTASLFANECWADNQELYKSMMLPVDPSNEDNSDIESAETYEDLMKVDNRRSRLLLFPIYSQSKPSDWFRHYLVLGIKYAFSLSSNWSVQSEAFKPLNLVYVGISLTTESPTFIDDDGQIFNFASSYQLYKNRELLALAGNNKVQLSTTNYDFSSQHVLHNPISFESMDRFYRPKLISASTMDVLEHKPETLVSLILCIGSVLYTYYGRVSFLTQPTPSKALSDRLCMLVDAKLNFLQIAAVSLSAITQLSIINPVFETHITEISL